MRPNGRVVPTTPHVPFESDNESRLRDLMRINNLDLSLGIDETTPIPSWSGESMDYGIALYSLQQLDSQPPEGQPPR